MTLKQELERNPRIVKIRRANPALADKIVSQDGYVVEDDVDALIAVDRLMMLYVRCGCGCFLCPAQSLRHYLTIIKEHSEFKAERDRNPMAGDYVRDVSIPAAA